jgi:hypothetical protein
LPTAIEQAVSDQQSLLANGYAQAFSAVAERIRSGDLKTTDAMASALVEATYTARLAADAAILHEMDLHFPQADDGTWQREPVADYLAAIASAYRKRQSSH